MSRNIKALLLLRLIVLFWICCITCSYYSSIPAERQPVVISIYQRREVVSENYFISTVCFFQLSKVCLYKTCKSISLNYTALHITELVCFLNATYFVRVTCHSLISNNHISFLGPYLSYFWQTVIIFVVFIVNNENIYVVLILRTLREKTMIIMCKTPFRFNWLMYYKFTTKFLFSNLLYFNLFIFFGIFSCFSL